MQSRIRNTLQVIGKKYATDKSAHRFKGLTYLQVYDFYFRDLMFEKVSLLELGVKRGASLRMWRDYFGNKSNIIGIDKNPACKKLNKENNIHVYTGLQDDKKFLTKVVGVEKCFNIIVDDASHINEASLKSFNFLWKYLKSGGFYVIEDVKQITKLSLKFSNYLDQRVDMKFLHFFPQLCIMGKV